MCNHYNFIKVVLKNQECYTLKIKDDIMADLLDYLDWRGDLDFNASSFNKVDALMLSLISYNIFDGFLGEDFASRKSMQEILEAFYKSPAVPVRLSSPGFRPL